MSRNKFRSMTTAEREQFWLGLYHEYKTYPGTLIEFVKEHDVSATAFGRWHKKFNDQRTANIANSADNLNESPTFSPIANVDIALQQAIDEIDESHLLEDEPDSLDKALEQLQANDNAILAAIELVLPQGYIIRLANHADVSLAIRLVQGIVVDE